MRGGGSTLRRRAIEVLVVAALLAWALQLLLGQWAHGQTMPPAMGQERFVATPAWSNSAMVELRSEAKVEGAEAKLKQLVRWGDVDAALMDQAGDLVVARLERGARVQAVGLDEIKRVLEGAGVNLAMLRFSGAAECKVSWGDTRVQTALAQAVGGMTSNMAGAAKNSSAVKSQFSNPKFETSDLKFQISDFRPETSDPNSEIPPRTLRELLLADLVDRLHLPAEAFVVKFSASDEKLVSLSEPLFRFEVQCRNPRGIGDVTWDVNVITDGGKQKAAVSATVGIWQVQLVAARPVGYQQVFTDADVIEKRIVVDQIREGSPLGKEQVVGQQANQGIGAGTVISSRMVEPLQVVRTGQLVTVTVEYGSVQIKWVGEARESGAVGQTIRVKKVKDGSRDEFNVTLTGPQEGKLAVGVKVAAR